MVRAYHVIITCYGFWLPNDPRGSWSDYVFAARLRPFGPATKTNTRRSVAAKPHDHAARDAAKRALLHPPVRLDGRQARAVARGFAACVGRLNIDVHAAVVMPDHAHLVIARHRQTIESLAGHLKRAATRQLNREQRHPLAGRTDRRGRTPTPWAEGGWFVCLNTDDDIARAVHYVERNPVKAGMKPQRWSFVGPNPRPGGRG